MRPHAVDLKRRIGPSHVARRPASGCEVVVRASQGINAYRRMPRKDRHISIGRTDGWDHIRVGRTQRRKSRAPKRRRLLQHDDVSRRARQIGDRRTMVWRADPHVQTDNPQPWRLAFGWRRRPHRRKRFRHARRTENQRGEHGAYDRRRPPHPPPAPLPNQCSQQQARPNEEPARKVIQHVQQRRQSAKRPGRECGASRENRQRCQRSGEGDTRIGRTHWLS